jgi:hypothetical protein
LSCGGRQPVAETLCTGRAQSYVLLFIFGFRSFINEFIKKSKNRCQWLSINFVLNHSTLISDRRE